METQKLYSFLKIVIKLGDNDDIIQILILLALIISYPNSDNIR